jgi:hypothetical protein
VTSFQKKTFVGGQVRAKACSESGGGLYDETKVSKAYVENERYGLIGGKGGRAAKKEGKGGRLRFGEERKGRVRIEILGRSRSEI